MKVLEGINTQGELTRDTILDQFKTNTDRQAQLTFTVVEGKITLNKQ